MNRIKYIVAASAIFALFVFAANKNYYRIMSGIDYVRNLFYAKTTPTETGISQELMNTLPLMKQTYKNLPAGFVHCSPFFIYTATENKTLDEVLPQAIVYTREYKISSLKKATIKYNKLSGANPIIAKGTSIVIPHSLPIWTPSPLNRKLPDIITARGLYMTGTSAGNPGLIRKLPEFKRRGLNTIVFDIKDVDGALSYRSRVPLAVKYNLHGRATIDNPCMFIRNLKENGIYVVARISVFRDLLLIKHSPELAVKSRQNGKIWQGGGERWCDPTNLAVQDYALALAMEAVENGVDEIQFDYIRFPTGGNLGDAVFSYQCGAMSKEAVIADFLKRAHKQISAANVRLSIDVFGVVAWGKPADIKSTGQRIEMLADYCDYISPMLYPSHFNNNFDGFKNPADNPEYFISAGNKKIAGIMAGKKVVIRPWLQAFKWKVSAYGPSYIIKQINASDASGGNGYLFWNASNEYGAVMSAMQSLFDGNSRPKSNEGIQPVKTVQTETQPYPAKS